MKIVSNLNEGGIFVIPIHSSNKRYALISTPVAIGLPQGWIVQCVSYERKGGQFNLHFEKPTWIGRGQEPKLEQLNFSVEATFSTWVGREVRRVGCIYHPTIRKVECTYNDVMVGDDSSLPKRVRLPSAPAPAPAAAAAPAPAEVREMVRADWDCRFFAQNETYRATYSTTLPRGEKGFFLPNVPVTLQLLPNQLQSRMSLSIVKVDLSADETRPIALSPIRYDGQTVTFSVVPSLNEVLGITDQYTPVRITLTVRSSGQNEFSMTDEKYICWWS